MVWSFDEVLLVRHGETEWNVAGRRQGRLDAPLTDRGRHQANRVAALVVDADTGADALFSSPLGRTRATAAVLSTVLDLPVQVLDQLAEVDHGRFSGLTSSEIEDQWPGAMANRENDKWRWRFPGGESYEDAATRAANALRELTGRSSSRPLVVTHEMIGRMLIGALLELPSEEALQWSLRQGTVLRIQPQAGRAEVLTGG